MSQKEGYQPIDFGETLESYLSDQASTLRRIAFETKKGKDIYNFREAEARLLHFQSCKISRSTVKNGKEEKSQLIFPPKNPYSDDSSGGHENFDYE